MDDLDRRVERPLTSREVSFVICGAFGGLLAGGMQRDAARDVLIAMAAFVVGKQAPSALPASTEPLMAMLGGIVGSLLTFCEHDAVLTAIQWTLENWDSLYGTRPGPHQVPS